MDLLNTPGNPIPPDALVVPVTTKDGVRLRAVRFPPTVRPVRGTVCLFQGRGEQIEKYFRLVEELRGRGFAVATFDWRGQGGSDRPFIGLPNDHIRLFSDFERDIEAFRRDLVLPDCPPPYFALAHSMGGLIVLKAARRLTPWISRMVLTAPFLDFGDVPFGRATIRRLTGIAGLVGLGRGRVPLARYARKRIRTFETNPLTSDRASFDMMMEITTRRPDLAAGPPSIRWVNQALHLFDDIDRVDFPASVPMPVMLVNCGGDVVVSKVAVERMARRLRGAAYVLIPGAKHEILMERAYFKAQFWAAFDAFVPGSSPY
jgi:lysophospholipase